MSRFLSVFFPCLVACAAYAQEDAAGGPPAETVSLVWVAVFGILFMGMIVGFFVYLWWKERHRKDGEQA